MCRYLKDPPSQPLKLCDLVICINNRTQMDPSCSGSAMNRDVIELWILAMRELLLISVSDRYVMSQTQRALILLLMVSVRKPPLTICIGDHHEFFRTGRWEPCQSYAIWLAETHMILLLVRENAKTLRLWVDWMTLLQYGKFLQNETFRFDIANRVA